MSNAQVLYLEHLILEKAGEVKHVPGKLLPHVRLLSRLQPLIIEADNEMSGNKSALLQAIEETRCWLKIGSQERMESFEHNVTMRLNCRGLESVGLTTTQKKHREQPGEIRETGPFLTQSYIT